MGNDSNMKEINGFFSSSKIKVWKYLFSAITLHCLPLPTAVNAWLRLDSL
jgi:hypothetical protein